MASLGCSGLFLLDRLFPKGLLHYLERKGVDVHLFIVCRSDPRDKGM